jgi:SAM-dependent methyltransferase
VTERGTCTVCKGRRVSSVLRIEGAPVFCSRLCHTRAAALGMPTAPIHLGFCPDCGHVFNMAFDSRLLEYSSDYENSLHCSGRFRDYEDELVDALVQRYQLSGRKIVEIGCGRGEFLEALCRRGGNRGFGFDPSYVADGREPDRYLEISLSGESYGSGHTDLRPDFICSRQTLEHIGEPRDFLVSIRAAAGRTGVPVFFEVPNVLYTLRDGGIWDIIFEHCSYFTSSSLARVFSVSGYRALDVAEAYERQFLTIHARTKAAPSKAGNPPSAELASLIATFAESYRRKVEDWSRQLQALHKQGRKAVVWGSGSKGIAFLNTLRPTTIDYVVDVNPRKQGKYTAGTGQQIVAPQFLAEYRPDVVVVMNPIYRAEIRRTTEQLGIRPQFLYA